eukprot:CAMPEP_0198132516 /NCGR_PEP_ID=MMETSP1442-20131203/58481_1 /TAXON_ID= /ORGANISM="Craspedostauros australis, Strain CCMP3328" /LENGTH=143 /DNA_ID=CAMNT_0043793529 /DNA_START=159 /DNA_END=587 /DNA_ORIENTATION=-
MLPPRDMLLGRCCDRCCEKAELRRSIALAAGVKDRTSLFDFCVRDGRLRLLGRCMDAACLARLVRCVMLTSADCACFSFCVTLGIWKLASCRCATIGGMLVSVLSSFVAIVPLALMLSISKRTDGSSPERKRPLMKLGGKRVR